MKRAIAVGIVVLGSWVSLRADQAVIVARKDNTINENNAGRSNGASTGMYVGRTRESSGASIRRALVAFDLTADVPPGSTITRVELRLVATKVKSSSARPASLHLALADWGEAGSSYSGGRGATAMPGDATWRHRFYDTQLWQSGGGDFDPAASATLSIAGTGTYVIASTSRMVADVQAWVDSPLSNSGWVLRGDESTGSTVKVLATHEYSNPQDRPTLTVEFRPPGCDPCDMDCDGNRNAFDVEPFIAVLFEGVAPCSPCAGDIDGNGERNAFDIEPFLNCLFP